MIRKSVEADLPALLRVYAAARETMRKNGNPTQWGDHRPEPTRIAADLAEGCGRCVERNGRVVGAFALLSGPDPTYGTIEGAWLDDAPYLVLHRVASDGTERGVLREILSYCDGILPNLRIDTHENNRIMRRLLEREGFALCGVIRLADGAPRLAYQRNRTEELPCKPF